MNYAQAEKLLSGRDRRKLENNTYLERRGLDFAVRLHSTDVVTIHPDGTYTLRTGGWKTVTTKDRINRYSPVRISQVKFEWFVNGEDFYSGMIVDNNGRIYHPDHKIKVF
jgi:hypothetical protein